MLNPWLFGLLSLAIGAPIGLCAWWVLRDIRRDVEREERRLAEDRKRAGR